MKKLLVSDYDQTFYLDDFDIEKNKKAVTKFKSKKIFLSSQRVEVITIFTTNKRSIILILIMQF